MCDEASTKHMDSMLHSLFQTVYAGDKNGEVLKLLITENFDSLSEEQKVHVLTRIEPENVEECLQRKSEPSKRMVKSDNYGLLGFIIKLDRVYCLKTILPLLPLYSVYERDVISPKMDTDNKSARELYKNKAVWEITATTCEPIETLCQDIKIASEIIESTRNTFGVTKANFQNASIDLDITLGFGHPNDLFEYPGIVCNKFKRLRQELILLSITITDGHEQNNAATEAIDTASECFVKAERIMPSIWDRFTYFNSDSLELEGIEAKIKDIDNVLQDIETVVSYIKRGKQNVETLRRGKKRAREDIEWESDNDKKLANQYSIWKLKRNAFTLLAAQIFAIVSKYKATQCAKLLLDKAPDFVHVEVEGKLALASALTSGKYSRQIVDMLVKNGARVGRVNEHDFAELCTQKPARDESWQHDSQIPDMNQDLFEGQVESNEEIIHIDWFYRIKLIIDDNEDLVKNYRDTRGNTLLHILVAQLHVVCDGRRHCGSEPCDFQDCVAKLLKVGINPTGHNISGQSVLHVLLYSLHQFPELAAYYCFFGVVQNLSPYFRNKKLQDENLLQNLFAAHHHRNCFIRFWTDAYHSIMVNDVMDLDFVVNSRRTPWQLVLGGHKHLGLHWPCIMCLRLSDMCKLAIQKGCNISQSIDAVASNPTRMSHSGYRPTVSENGELRAVLSERGSDCCYLTLLKVLLNNGADIRPLLKLDPANARIVTLIRMVSDPKSEHCGSTFHTRRPIKVLTITEMYQICKAFVLYYPGCSENLMSSLIRATNSEEQNDIMTKNEMTQKLHQLLTTPRSLKFLAKRSILRGMQRKQVDRLLLPTALKVYIQADEIEKDETD